MPKPSTLPEWATGGAANVIEPSLANKQAGWSTAKPPHQWFNWWMKNVYQWIQYVNGLTGADLAVSGTDATKIDAALTAKLNASEKGANSGVATLTPGGKLAQAPADGSITTAMLAAAAVSQIGYAEVTSGNIATTNTTWTDASASLSVTMNTTGGDVLVFIFSAYCGGIGTANVPGAVGVSVDGTDYAIARIAIPSNSYFPFLGVRRFTGLSAGSHTFKTRYKIDGGGVGFYLLNNGGYNPNTTYIMVVELKK